MARRKRQSFTREFKAELQREKRLHALASFVKEYEAEHGVIRKEDMKRAARAAEARTIHVRT